MANDETATVPEFQRASDYATGIGETLDTYQGRDLLLRSFEISKRAMKGSETDFVSMEISEFDPTEGPSEDVIEVHAWSKSLAEKLGEVPVERLPLLVQFYKTTTSSGFKVWTFR